LLAGAGLMVHTIGILNRTDLGFESRNLLMVNVDLVGAHRASMDVPSRVNYFDRLRNELSSVNGVVQVAIFRDGGHVDILPEGSTSERQVDFYECSTNLISCLQVPLIKGRCPNELINEEGLCEIMVNETFAKQCWPGQDPIGKRIKIANVAKAVLMPVVGVIRDFKMDRSELKRPIALVSYRLSYLDIVSLFVRVQDENAAVIGSTRATVRDFDSTLRAPRVRTMSELLYEVIESKRLALWLLGGFSAVSLVLSVLGVYGVISDLVSQREREMGIRLAIGAQPKDLIAMVIRQGMSPVLAGIVCGIVGSLELRILLENQVFGIGKVDWISLSICILLVIIVALVACFLPAFKAGKTDPILVLRQE